MSLQPEIPRPRDSSREEEWPFNLWDFLTDNFWYLLALAIVLAVFFYSRWYFKKH